MKKLYFVVFLISIGWFQGNSQVKTSKTMIKKVTKTDEVWKKELTPQQYFVLRQKGTDAPSSGGLTSHFEKGTYHCAACNLQLFK